jgi:serine/threonine protein kinase
MQCACPFDPRLPQLQTYHVKPFEVAKPGTKLAGYSVLAEIGRGAASIVYLVQDPKTKQVYALKHVEKNEPKDSRFIDQAEAEYQVAVKVKHPTIRAIYDAIKTREMLISVKEIFLVMEYVDGVSIEKKMPPTFEAALAAFIQVSQGLAHMHKCGYVHADMKPNNIVVMADGSVKVIDLGQACAVGTVKERIQGTPDYIAPEQVHRRAITAKTDIYNLGATMYWVLTKKNIPTAMPRENSLVGSVDDQFIEKAKPVRDLNPRCPEMLSDLIMACVQVDPDARPSDMNEVTSRLELVLGKLKASQAPKTAPDDTGALEDTAI